MINYLIIGTLALFSLNAQKNMDCEPVHKLTTGDMLVIAGPSASTYKYINLPRPNFLIKRGGIANFNKLQGQQVEVTEVKTTEDCKMEVRVKRQDGKKFFNSLKTISIDLDKALETDEVRLVKGI